MSDTLKPVKPAGPTPAGSPPTLVIEHHEDGTIHFREIDASQNVNVVQISKEQAIVKQATAVAQGYTQSDIVFGCARLTLLIPPPDPMTKAILRRRAR